MSSLTLQKLRPLIANDQFFRRHTVALALKTLWIVREQKDADLLASDLIKQALYLGEIKIINEVPASRTGGMRYYSFVEENEAIGIKEGAT